MRLVSRGFAVIKLVLILVILGVVVALILNSIGNVQAKKRDETRKQKLNTIATELDTCFAAGCNKTYPHIGELQDDSVAGWVETHLPKLPKADLYDFKSVKIQENPPSDSAELQYDPRTADGKPCSLYTDMCLSYTLRAYLETDLQNPYSKGNTPHE